MPEMLQQLTRKTKMMRGDASNRADRLRNQRRMLPAGSTLEFRPANIYTEAHRTSTAVPIEPARHSYHSDERVYEVDSTRVT